MRPTSKPIAAPDIMQNAILKFHMVEITTPIAVPNTIPNEGKNAFIDLCFLDIFITLLFLYYLGIVFTYRLL